MKMIINLKRLDGYFMKPFGQHLEELLSCAHSIVTTAVYGKLN